MAALETAVAELPEWVVLRYGTPHGPGTWYTAGGLMAQLAEAGKRPANADVASCAHVDDPAPAAVSALACPTRPVNICDAPRHRLGPGLL